MEKHEKAPNFPDGKTIIGWNLLEFIDWADESARALDRPSSTPDLQILALPPMQRSAVWRPKQVVDLWDSLMRGFPIGTFYLVKRTQGTISTWADTTKQTEIPGFDLLDGQQRVRALLLGVIDIQEENKRCLWVDLGDAKATERPILHITSKAQPFGYDADGRRLSRDQRRHAREEIEGEGHLKYTGKGTKLGPAYDHHLFDPGVTLDGKPISSPPKPHRASKDYTFKLHDLFKAWRQCAHQSDGECIDALASVAESRPSSDALETLHKAFRKIESAEVALLQVDPMNFDYNRKNNTRPDESLLELFERIGDGGTRLSEEEKLYSVYKFHEPYIRDAVKKIHGQAGRVLSPTSIAATAIRIANAQTHADRNDTPGFAAFAKAMRDKTVTGENFLDHLHKLIPQGVGTVKDNGALFHGFDTIKGLLSFQESAENFWIPDVMLASLPVELWQVLVFWAVSHPELRNPKLTREEAVRFSLFWYLCVENDEKAAQRAFHYIKESSAENSGFPGADLYRRLIGKPREERCALALISTEVFEQKLCKSGEPEWRWRTNDERFVEDNEIGLKWWSSGKKMLPWLQREYIRRVFPDYLPLTDQEDDVPYDDDHICPRNDWRTHLWGRLDIIDEKLKESVYSARDAVGEGIGNKRLIIARKNRQDQDIDVAEKMTFISNAIPQEDEEEDMKDFAFSPDHRELWKGVSSTDRRWNASRLGAFQKAVEKRAAWLYQRFYNDLEYNAWTSKREDPSNSE